jgi:serine/threonine protein phosphatase PrpC
MITCPECGQTAPDEARFCDRCGRALHDVPAPVVALEPLAVGRELQDRFRIVEVISRSSQENRYRAVALEDANRRFMLRERVAPSPAISAEPPPKAEAAASAPEEDPAGPRAKTRELPPLSRAASAEQTPESAEQAEGGLQEVKSEAENPAPTQPESSSPEATVNGAAGEPDTNDQAQGDDSGAASATESAGTADHEPRPARADLGEVFERVLALSQIITHPAYSRALEGFAQDGRVYLVYSGEELRPFSARALPMVEHEALSTAIQICQAISYLHSRGMRVNDICPSALAYGADGRIKLTSLDFVSNDDELQAEPILNDGYTAPEIYRAKRVDKRADVFSIGCVLYTCLTGQRIECETWREEAGPIRFYPPHVVSPDLEKAVRKALAFRPADRWAGTDQLKTELLKLNARMRIRSACLTDVGMVREHNEDSVMAVELIQESQVWPAHHYLYVVSDGMGGAEAGETASAIAVETIRYYVDDGVAHGVSPSAQNESSEQGGTRSPEQLLAAALEQAHSDIIAYQTNHPESRGMGATAVSALVSPPDAAIAWVGDSRAYLLEGGRLRQLTKDHSLVQRLVDIGQITPEQARHHEHKNVITRSLGARANAPAGAEAMSIRLKRGDRLLLCSDGLMAHVEDSAIAEILARRSDPMEASRELVVAANAGGGSDNISVIVIDAQ